MRGAASVGSVARALALLAGYCAAVVFLTWPLAASLTTHHYRTIASFDTHHLTWTLAWESHVLASDPSSFADANIFHPEPNALFRGPTAIGALPLFAPVFLATQNPTLALNLTYLGGLVLTAWGLHLLLKSWTGSHAAGLVAGATFLTCETAVRGLAASAPDHGALMYFPAILFLVADPALPLASAALLAPLIALQSLVNVVYIAPVVMAPLAVIAVLRLARPESRAGGARLALALLLGLVLMAPVFFAYLSMFSSSPSLGEESRWAVNQVLAPSSLTDVLRFNFDAPSINAAQTTPVMLALFALGALAALSRRRDSLPSIARHGLVVALVLFAVSFTMSLGTHLAWGSHLVRLPLGYLQEWIPALARIRVAPRVGVAGLIGLCAISGLAFAASLAWLRPRLDRRDLVYAVPPILGLVLACAMYFQERRLAQPVKLQRAPVVDAALLPTLRASHGPLLVLPQGLWQDARAMYQSIDHWRPLLNGYSSYWPPGFLERMETARRLPDPEALAALRRETGLELIWVNVDGLPPAKRRAWDAAEQQGRLRTVVRTESVRLFEVAR